MTEGVPATVHTQQTQCGIRSSRGYWGHLFVGLEGHQNCVFRPHNLGQDIVQTALTQLIVIHFQTLSNLFKRLVVQSITTISCNFFRWILTSADTAILLNLRFLLGYCFSPSFSKYSRITSQLSSGATILNHYPVGCGTNAAISEE
jgi:hypothetical protein